MLAFANSRRKFAIGLVALLFATRSSAQGAIARIALYKEAADVVSAAADAMSKVGEDIKAFVVAGYKAYSVIAADRQYTRLKDISARATNLVNSKQALVAQSIDDYLAKRNPKPEDWRNVTENIDRVMVDFSALMADVKAERGDLVLDTAYAKVTSSLTSRSIVLSRIKNLPMPRTQEERAELKRINFQYKRLLEAFRTTIQEMNNYIKSTKTG